MEDLFPLLIFLVIVAINAIKFFAERGKTKKPAPQTGEAPPKRASSIESFFENLAKQMEPKPTELPDWPNNTGHKACCGTSPSAISASTRPKALLTRITYRTSSVALLVLRISRAR